jgi:lipopolysaccharide export system ATP-binding protein
MTDPADRSAMRQLAERLAGGDRSIALALLALIGAADANGTAGFNDVATRYRGDYLAQLRAEGRDAEREAGRLSLDEVRAHLATAVLPRLAATGAIELPAEGIKAPDQRIAINTGVWREIAPVRREFEAAIRETGEHAAVPAPAPPAHPAASGSVLTARGLTKVYRRRAVVRDVDMQVRQGEIVGLLGPNGAGKTTMLYMIVGLISQQKGTIHIDGEDITKLPMYKRARRGIGYLSQEPSVFRKLTVEENLLAILETQKLSRAERRKRLETLLDELSIKHLRQSKAYALSGGERRRLEITRALTTDPRFMMLDEPFAGVDPIAVHDIQTIVAGLRHRGIGVVISDHNVEQTLDIVDRAYILFDGAVQVSGTVRDLVFDDKVAEIYLGPTLTARLRERFAANGGGPGTP